MDPAEASRRAERAEALRTLRKNVCDADVLTYAARRLVEGVNVTPDPEDMDDTDESLNAACALLRIARRVLRYVKAELHDEIARTEYVASNADDDAPESDAADRDVPPTNKPAQ